MGDEPYQQWKIEWTPELREKSKDWANSNNAVSESEFRNNPYSVIYYDFYKKGDIEKQLLKKHIHNLSEKIKALNVENLTIQEYSDNILLTFHNSKGSKKKNTMEFGISIGFPPVKEKRGHFVYDQPRKFYESAWDVDLHSGELKFGEWIVEYYLDEPLEELRLDYFGTWQPQFRKGDFSEKELRPSIDGLIKSIELVGQELNSLQKWKQTLKVIK